MSHRDMFVNKKVNIYKKKLYGSEINIFRQLTHNKIKQNKIVGQVKAENS